jgi:hypothetical protein
MQTLIAISATTIAAMEIGDRGREHMSTIRWQCCASGFAASMGATAPRATFIGLCALELTAQLHLSQSAFYLSAGQGWQEPQDPDNM